ncbi:MAG: prolipoprotein diacylglyceryl transferase [Patescibacteria group bacterium]
MVVRWQSIMELFDPIAITIGSFQIHWYALCFLLAWLAALVVTLSFEQKNREARLMSAALWQDLFWWLLFGGLVGARIGFAIFYEPVFFWNHPGTLFLPYDFVTETFVPFRGLSFHGGLLGVGVVLGIWSYQKKIALFALTDRLALIAPVISVFGRLGNFLNQELPGRITESTFGVYFPGETVLRHPATLYGLFFEGIFLFWWLGFWQKRVAKPGTLTVLYLVSYGLVRFILEYFREPDPGVALLWDTFTRGQLLSLGMFFGAGLVWFWSSKHATIENN